MSRTVIGLVAVGVAVMASALGFGWYAKQSEKAAIEEAAKPAPEPTAATKPAPAQTEPAKPPASADTVMVPSFDVVRVGPDGRAVIAGRAAPKARIVLLDGGKEIAKTESDARGEWVILVQDPPLAPGQHELRVVQHLEGRAPVTSEQAVIVVVPPAASAGKEESLVMIDPPRGGTTLLQPPTAAGVARSGDLAVSTLDYDERGQMTVSGLANANSAVRIYLDGKAVAEGKSGADGRWRLSPEQPVSVGKHVLRVERLAADGKPAQRLEMTFERAVMAAGGDGRRLHIVHGDNLWSIARAHYGEGTRFTVIFEANKDRIRDPNLIYPGQVFSLPKSN